MKSNKQNGSILISFIVCLLIICPPGIADDTCIFDNSPVDGPFTFIAPVVPIANTTSSNQIYLTFFTKREGPFWEGNVVKFGLSDNNQIVDALFDPDNPDHSDPESPNNRLVIGPDGVIKETAQPYWATEDWATFGKANYVHHANRNIYTFLGLSRDLTNITNEFNTGNLTLTSDVLGNPVEHTVSEIVDFIRGADVFDEDADGNTSENRGIITGDVLHSEPLVISYNESLKIIYFGSNGGMLHAVRDSDGTEIWGFIPPDQLSRLKFLVEGDTHPHFVDSSPKAYLRDVNGNGIIEEDVDSDGDGDIDEDDRDQVILVCGERKGGTSYFALDVTTPFSPIFLWRINKINDESVLNLPSGAGPDEVVPELGESWSEPQFGIVKTTGEELNGGTPTPAFFIGGGYSLENSSGKAILVVNALTGTIVKKFSNIVGMDFSFPSAVTLVDSDNNGRVDKLYVGDLGGQMWRLGNPDTSNFPNIIDENINSWSAQIVFNSDPAHQRKFFYAPSVTLEIGYDLILTGTGDREDVCNPESSDRIYAVKDVHNSITLNESDLIDATDVTADLPDLNINNGWYIRLASGEKVITEGLVFLRIFYVPTYLPGEGGVLLALNYKTAETADYLPSREVWEGSGILSKPVVIIDKTGQEQSLLASIGNLVPEGGGESAGPGILTVKPVVPPINFFYLWWREM